MATIAVENRGKNTVVTPAFKGGILTQKFGDLESKRFGIVPVALIWTVCWGSVAVALGAMQSPLLLSFLVVPTMSLLSFCLAVQPMRLIVWTSIIATLIDWAVISFLLLS